MENEKESEVELLGDYKILYCLGQTSWSQDFLAEHRFIKKRYGIKLLLPELAISEAFMKAFHDVVIKLARLKHRGVAVIENVSQISKQCFLVMQEHSVAAIPLTQYLASLSQPLTELEIVALVHQLAELLDYVHNAGVFQGAWDLNTVHIQILDNVPEVLLPELGFSSLVQERALQELLIGESEQKQVKLRERILFQVLEQPSEERTQDVYAFGMIVYYLLFGFLPQGVFPMPSIAFPSYVYDWDRLLCSCLSYSLEERARVLSPLIRKKLRGDQFLSVISTCTQGSLREVVEDVCPVVSHPDVMRGEGAYQVIQQEEATEHLEFVLVEACSIDEAMDTSVSAKLECEKEEDYSHALQSLLVREPVVSRYIELEKEKPKPLPLFTEMVLIEGGEFSRGSSEGQRDELPVHKIILNSFFLDIYPVTNEQFIRYLNCCDGEQDRYYNELIRLKDSRIQRRSGKLVIEPGYAKHPVVGVTWYGATGYADWVEKRLPTEAEWEIAACGGAAQLRYPCGKEVEKSQANFFTSDTTAVMSYPCNSYGLYDMAGNVYEWCQDWYGYDFYEISAQEPESPQGPAQGVYRVLRGGCWKSLKDDLRCAHRHRNNPGAVNSTYGFRCARNVG
ncbi:SUMF1/EgtB/PvdO family nonheme iron enzyme [Candidatus Chlamydia sanziniae]|nr:SUMF1/EgtB/PvdO family nonheme iron enzyme [Candidatus Chlamydia sanziniae]